MTREEYLKICKICENRRHDYEHGLVCRLTGKSADFNEKCPSFVLDNEVVVRPDISNDTNQYDREEDDYSSGSSWRTVLAIIVAVIAVVRLFLALNR